jgi:ribosomal protein L40E
MQENIQSSDLMGKLKIGITKGLRIVNVRSKEAYDVIRIRNEIGGKEKYKKKLIQDLGNAVFRTYKHKGSFSEESIKVKCGQLENVESEIEELTEKIKLVHENALKELGKLKALSKPNNNVKCQKCGVENTENSTKCKACGSDIEVAVT